MMLLSLSDFFLRFFPRKKSENDGFTLVELIIVFSIMAFLSSGAIAAFVSYSRAQAISAAASEIFTSFQVAKSRTLSQVKPNVGICNTSNAKFEGYVLAVCRVFTGSTPSSTGLCLGGGNDYEMHVLCGGNTIMVEGKKLPSQMMIDTATTARRTFFYSLTGGVDKTGLIRLRSTFGSTKDVIVGPGGNISIN